MGKMQTQIDYPRGITFEQVWAALMENREQMKETDRIVKENAISQKETDRIVKEIGKRLGDFTNSFGDIVENMIAPNLQEKFNELGYDFQEASTKHKVRDKKNGIKLEIDVFLQNGDTAMLVEIKSDLTISYINEHIDRLKKMRLFADIHGDKRAFLGAVAGIVIPNSVKEYALNNGFYLIEPCGEDINITNPHNKPKKW